MLINGEKYACEACVRGHRVSNCQHSDRPLQHINKKGRPVSQCQHCRAMRKSRASHVKCDCGEKTHKCMHLKTTVEGHKDSCCCNHGGRCTCSHKKEPLILDTVPESDSDADAALSKTSKSGSRSRRRANTTSSDGLLAFDANGHHKPTYKHTKVSQKCGPYQIHRVNSLHSSSSVGNRSVDNLMQAGSGSDSHAAESPSSSGSGEVVTQMQRRVKSEAASPLMTGSSFTQLNGALPPLDLSAIKYTPYVPNSADFFSGISDHDQPLFSAGLSAASVDWSNFDGLNFANKAGDFAPSSYSQSQSYGTYDYAGSEQIPTLTTNTSTSGEVSEAEDLLSNPLDDFDVHYRNSTAANGYPLGQAGLMTSTDLGAFDFDEYHLIKAGNKFLPTPSSLAGDESTLLAGTSAGYTGYSLDEDPGLWMGDYSGLPSFTDSPTEANLPAYWDGQ
ncbi:copper resistance protein CRF1 [Echria macrotheca]|uniref:Copper resistance protein CRF1 n=1 Tax=Echria macrotheca TaxID=438768 RepID=A0AAJ0BM49_9PEZI|nr:copper resistance protein CRF1 [Echria macrotheca]